MSRSPAPRIRIGVSGWRYAPWRGSFYPKGLPQSTELGYAAKLFEAIEINGSFYSLQRPESYQAWFEQTPPGFVFAVKGPRYITHMKRLNDVKKAAANFFASGIFNLRGKLGPILWQFPPNFVYRYDRMAAFLELLPRDTAAAAALARRRDAFMAGRTRLAIDVNRPLHHAFEIRNETFADRSFIELLRKHNAALVIAETARRWPMLEDITADFVYIRLHGDKELYRSGYGDKALSRWSERIAAWHAGREPPDARKAAPWSPPGRRRRDVYCFFDNTDVKLRAPFDAQALMKKLQAPAYSTLDSEILDLRTGSGRLKSVHAAQFHGSSTFQGAGRRFQPHR
jgi:uncharacterized protein YecE (DUF72 family)